MIEALRGLGYSTGTALADIIDNSIAAGASRVELTFAWNGAHNHIAVLDDGAGMDASQLDRAMRLGERNPLDRREPGDLGRFGLGLKTASFSQCRRLTVASARGGEVNCLRWDLDVLAASADDGWHLLEGPDPASAALLLALSGARDGTLVLWERLDRTFTAGFAEQNLLDLIDAVERHLAMTFHRYLAGEGREKLGLSINGRPVAPWDPFLVGHPCTWSSPVVRLPTPAGPVEAQGHVLPHRDRLDVQALSSAAGPDGWTAQQGFYVYRNRRLLVAGSWLGLGRGRAWTKEEAHRLARIRLDLPNTADADWKIDIRKSVARPPVIVREQLIRLAEDTRERARRVFAHRGHVMRPGKEAVAQAWRAERFEGGMRYRIDEDHPAVRALLDEAGALAPQVRAMLRVIEATVPVQRIWLDTTENRETPRTGFAGDPPAEVAAVLTVMYRNLIFRRGMSAAAAREQLLRTEPFHNFPELVGALPDELATERT